MGLGGQDVEDHYSRELWPLKAYRKPCCMVESLEYMDFEDSAESGCGAGRATMTETATDWSPGL